MSKQLDHYFRLHDKSINAAMQSSTYPQFKAWLNVSMMIGRLHRWHTNYFQTYGDVVMSQFNAAKEQK